MNKLPALFLALLFIPLAQASNTTFAVQWSTDGTNWFDASGATGFTVTANLSTPMPAGYSETVQFRFYCTNDGAPGVTPTASGGAAINKTKSSTCGAKIFESNGGTSTASCSTAGLTATATALPNQQNQDPKGPNPLPYTVSGSSITWNYDMTLSKWIGTCSLGSVSCTGSASLTVDTGTSFRDQSNSVSSLGTSASGIITSNSIMVTP